MKYIKLSSSVTICHKTKYNLLNNILESANISKDKLKIYYIQEGIGFNLIFQGTNPTPIIDVIFERKIDMINPKSR